MNRTPEIETKRLHLREVQREDAQEIYNCWMNDPDVSRYMFWEASSDFGEVKKFVEFEISMQENRKWNRWIIERKETKEMIGTGLIYYDEEEGHWDLSYNLGKKYWGRGYTTEAMRGIMHFAEEVLGMEECTTTYAKENTASANVLKKLGFRFVEEVPYTCCKGKVTLDGVRVTYQKNRLPEEKKKIGKLGIRPFREGDATEIVKWCRNEREFYQWTAGLMGEYPLKPEKLLEVTSGRRANTHYFPFVAFDENGIVGFFTVRVPGDRQEVRFGFVILDPEARGRGYGKKMLQLGMIFAYELYGADKVSLGVFDNNPAARYCYRAAGFRETGERECYKIGDEIWNSLVMEAKRK